MDDAGRKRGRHNFVEMMQTASDDKEGSPNEFSDSSEASSYESNDKEAPSSELDGKEAFHGPNHKKAKSTTDPLGDFSKLGVLDKRDDLNCSNAQGPLSDFPVECSRRVSENRVSVLPTRPTVSNAGTARDISQGAHVNSLLRQSILARSGYARDIPRSVLVDSSLRKSAATGSGRDVPFAVPFDPLPTGSTLIHGGSARCVSDAVPFNSLPTAYHSGYAREIPLAVPITVRSTTDVRELTGMRQGLLHNHTGGVSKLSDSYGHNVAASDVMQSIHQMLNGNNGKYLQASQITSHGVEFLKTLLSNKVPILAQDPASAAPGLTGNYHQGPKVTVAVPSYCSKQRINYVNRKSGRIRRARITERFKSLQEILPNSDQANRDDLMDDIIDYVKYLQLQIKSLSQSTLEDETTDRNNPFINLEGFGHYLHNQGTLVTEPLEDMVGMLMQVNKPAFTQLLESRGLYVKPMALAGTTIYKP